MPVESIVAGVGRTVAAKKLDKQAVRFAVVAHIRHTKTNYDDLITSLVERSKARTRGADVVAEVQKLWEFGSSL